MYKLFFRNTNLRVEPIVFNRVKELGIRKTFRGQRGRPASIKMSMNWKANWDYNNTVHRELLRSLPNEHIYNNNNNCKLGLINA
ncbi:hypothetical protein HOLleu_03607 [Holothuria leucospilota]|uniref:Uncharacterized protein n=1 Tax=Holothuria leucospilota TaxID=206669 RepID=A0A9Q1CTM9_HOLLE|nr:hypothetical protein HOLleu_03607 [Holothuria leucospilota]